MFDDVKNQDQNTLQPQVPVDDMFSNTDPAKGPDPVARPSAVDTGKIRSASAVAPTVGPAQPLRDLSEVQDWAAENKGSGMRRLAMIGLIIVGIIVVGGIGWWGYSYVTTTLEARKQAETNTNGNVNLPVNQNPINIVVNQPLDDTPTVTTPPVIDQDQDGLSDVEEQSIGTDISLPDTDRDGLTDYEEVKSYLTNPLLPDTDNDGLNDREEVFVWITNANNPDTDADGYMDGEEVAGGYNPLGAGKLPTLPSQ